jgi:hypothetical protein
MHTIKWKTVHSSDAPNCDECKVSFANAEARLLGEDENKGQYIIHTRCKSHWEKRTGYSEI